MTFNWDPMGKLLIELRQDAAVAAIVGVNPTSATPRVRAVRPAPKTNSYDGDAHGPGEYRAFVVVTNLGGPRWYRVPIQQPRFLARCYGRDAVEAAELGRAVSDSIHYIGPRVHSGGLGFYSSFDSNGGEQDEDPDTQQPLTTVFIDILATTQAVAV